jgi:CheY-like chemotaxis protein
MRSNGTTADFELQVSNSVNGFLLSGDLMFSSRVTGAAKAQGVQVAAVANAAALVERLDADTRLVMLDLGSPGLDPAECVRSIRAQAPQVKIVAYAPHVHEQRLAAAAAAGCDEVLTRGQFNAGIGPLLARYLGGE